MYRSIILSSMASLAFLVMRSSALLILATRKNGSQQRLSSGRSLFVDQLNTETSFVAPLQSTMDNNNEFDKAKADEATTATSSSSSQQRRSLLVTSLQSVLGVITSVGLLGSNTATVVQAAEVDDFASIAALASKISQDLQNSKDDDDDDVASPSTATTTTTTRASSSSSTAYDFTLPMSGSAVNFRELVAAVNPESPPKAIIVVNIKQDDPLARKNIPELISLAAKYGRNGEFVVVACPTDQGYFEADTSTLIRLKLASEYGYGINPATIITDKVNLLGKSAHPFWRWLEGTCRTPAGLGRVEGNFEKFLLDGKTGMPLRRYPRKYMPLDMQDDIDAVLESRALPPPSSNWKEEWRVAAAEAERDTYRFQKGLNVF